MKLFSQVKYVLLSGLLLTSWHTVSYSQDNTELPVVGQVIPAFKLNNITHYKTKTATDQDFRGKWLILDFWFTGCRACIYSFPKVSALTTEYHDKVNWVLVGLNNSRNKGIEEKYEKLRESQGLVMAAAYDTAIAERWDIHAMPHLVIADPEGIVRHITNGSDLTSEKMAKMVNGEAVSFRQKGLNREDFNPREYDGPVVYRSLLTKWNGEKQESGYNIDQYVTYHKGSYEKGWNASMIPLVALYDYAYLGNWHFNEDEPEYGNYWKNPILEVNDKTPFEFDYVEEFGKGTYNYNLVIPVEKVTKEYLMEVMQRELKNALGYEAMVETRDIPAMKLIAMPGAKEKLASKGKDSFVTSGSTMAGFSMKNHPAKELLLYLKFYIDKGAVAFVDETGLVDNIDFEINVDMTDLNAIRKVLNKYRLALVDGTHNMKVVVIRDRKKD